MSRKRSVRPRSWFREHSLSLLLSGLLMFLVLMYGRSDPKTHLGAFYGNAIADWLGVLVFVVATKYFVEVGSGEMAVATPAYSRRATVMDSLTIVLAMGAGLALYGMGR